MAKKKPEEVKKSKEEWQYEKIASIVGKWAWVILLLDALIYLILGIVYEVQIAQAAAAFCAAWNPLLGPCPRIYTPSATDVWYIIGAIITVIFSILIVRPRFSNQCAAKEWDVLMEDVLVVGEYRIPAFLIDELYCQAQMSWKIDCNKAKYFASSIVNTTVASENITPLGTNAKLRYLDTLDVTNTRLYFFNNSNNSTLGRVNRHHISLRCLFLFFIRSG